MPHVGSIWVNQSGEQWDFFVFFALPQAHNHSQAGQSKETAHIAHTAHTHGLGDGNRPVSTAASSWAGLGWCACSDEAMTQKKPTITTKCVRVKKLHRLHTRTGVKLDCEPTRVTQSLGRAPLMHLHGWRTETHAAQAQQPGPSLCTPPGKVLDPRACTLIIIWPSRLFPTAAGMCY